MMRAASCHRTAVAVALGAFLAMNTGAALAAGGDEAAAEALFVEAKKLAGQKKYADACPKFAESNRLDRGAGTMIHLGDCYERNHQLASAWATYKEASSAAQALNRKDWEKLATQRATSLEPKLAHLTIKVESPVEKLAVSRDGTDVSSASFGVPIPVDAGDHKIVATAVGFKTYTTTSTVAKDGQSAEVVVPRLEADPVAPTAPLAPAFVPAQTNEEPTAEKQPSSRRSIGFVVGGIGIAGIAVGAVTGLMAIGKKNDATAACPKDGACSNRSAVDSADSAKTLATVSTIGFIAGGALLVGGAVLVATAPKHPKKQTGYRFVPSAGPTGAGLNVLGVF